MQQLIIISILAVLTTLVSTISFADILAKEEWNAFKVAHGKVYSNPMEDQFRMKIYTENKFRIARHNRLAHEGHSTFFMKINRFGDFFPYEIAALHGLRRSLNRSQTERMVATFIAPEGF